MIHYVGRWLFLLPAALGVASCSTLPRDGPTARAILQGARSSDYAMVDLDYAASETLKSAPDAYLNSLIDEDGANDVDLIGPGDGLLVSIFEPGGGLFSTGIGGEAARASAQTLPLLVVDAAGTVAVPYAGAVRVAGLSPSQAAQMIKRALAGRAANPQVLVSVAQNAFNTVVVLGEVTRPGRAALTTNADRILDVIAERGGVARAIDDVVVRIDRGGRTLSIPLGVLTSRPAENIKLRRGDQLNLVYYPRRFSSFGALGQVTQVDMPAGSLSLAGAISKIGGLDTNSADARSVLVFRFERPEAAANLGISQVPTPRGVPVVYRLNLEDPSGFFAAENFQIRPDDIIYVPRSGSAELSKFFTLVQTISRVVYDVSVTSALSND